MLLTSTNVAKEGFDIVGFIRTKLDAVPVKPFITLVASTYDIIEKKMYACRTVIEKLDH